MDPLLAAGAGLFILTLGEIPNYYSGVLPSWMTIRRFSADDKDTGTLRWGMAMASVFALAVGVGGSLISHSPWPLIGTIAGMVFLIFGYEWAIRHPHDDACAINAPENLTGNIIPLNFVK